MTSLCENTRFFVSAIALSLLAFAPAQAATSVSLPGSFNSEIGCAGDWDPACPQADLVYDPVSDRWTNTFTIPAGNWEYKVAIDDSWDENYGIGGALNGANIPLSLTEQTDVFFSYDPVTHVVSHSTDTVIVVAPGSFQSELGCPGDWMPDCLNSELTDPDLDGVYTFSTSLIPPGCYESKIALDQSWNVNYGVGGVQNGDNLNWCVSEPNSVVTFTWDSTTFVPTVTVEVAVPIESSAWGTMKAMY
jgi:hypothetical protein